MANFNNEVTSSDGVHRLKIDDLASAQTREPKRQLAIELVELKLTQGLQRSLNIQSLLEFFCQEIAEIVPCDSVAYQHSEYRIAHIHGKSETHVCQYQLELEGQHLGELICTRAHPFGDMDLLTIEGLAGTLVYPLRNALLYQQALDSALQDPLTSVGNRKALDHALRRETTLVERHNSELSMLMIDIDLFKGINDGFGHAAGDQALRNVTQMISSVIRQSDQVFRYGGEEFVVLLSNTDVKNANDLAERIRKAIEQTEICYGNFRFRLTVSIGVAAYNSLQGTDSLFNTADKALYEAKNNGRNRVIAA